MEFYIGYLNDSYRFSDVLYKKENNKMFFLSTYSGWCEATDDYFITYFPIEIEEYKNSLYPEEVISKLIFYKEILE